jgi:hypothetical protein
VTKTDYFGFRGFPLADVVSLEIDRPLCKNGEAESGKRISP